MEGDLERSLRPWAGPEDDAALPSCPETRPGEAPSLGPSGFGEPGDGLPSCTGARPVLSPDLVIGGVALDAPGNMFDSVGAEPTI